MKEISLHIMDIVQNSITANAKLIEISLVIDRKKDVISITIKDNGKGMSKEMLANVTSPFVTTRTTRRVGLGLSLFKDAAEGCDGRFEIQSEENVGTRVYASFAYDHIDRMPLGNMPDSVITMLMSFGEAELVYVQRYNEREFVFDSREVKEILGEDSLMNDPDVLNWIRGYVEEGLEEITEE